MRCPVQIWKIVFSVEIAFLFSIVLAPPQAQALGYLRGGYIKATLLDYKNYTYRISFISFSDAGTDLFLNGGLNFGDGSNEYHFEEDYEYAEDLGNQVSFTVQSVEHTYPGPGTYLIRYRVFSRIPGIANMDNSINTPFYVETKIIIDPYLGPNSTIDLMNLLPQPNKTDIPFRYSFITKDADGDSVSMEPAIPLQDKDTPVSNYSIPSSREGNRLISELDYYNTLNEIQWVNPLNEGDYCYSIRFKEWRKISGEWIEAGYTLFDFQVLLLNIQNNPAIVSGIQDTAILAGKSFETTLHVSDPENDCLRIFVSSNLPDDGWNVAPLKKDSLYRTPADFNLSINAFSELKRSDPFKIVVNTLGKGFETAAGQNSYVIWITDTDGLPEAPSELTPEMAFRNMIRFSWQDNSNIEAGFIIERADSFFPDFIRIGALPINATEYTDTNVVPNRDYFYRVKAIGTLGSAYSDIMEVSELDIITGINQEPSNKLINIFPNPTGNYLYIQFPQDIRNPESITILDHSGKIIRNMPVNELDFRNKVLIPVQSLTHGIYIINFNWSGHTLSRKFLKF